MPGSFDAYHKWLGIAPEEQPADLYRLLGVRRFETDADVIAEGADRQMAHVRTKMGRHVKAAQKLLNEIGAAKVRLLDPQRKWEYDQQLRASHLQSDIPLPEFDASVSDSTSPGIEQQPYAGSMSVSRSAAPISAAGAGPRVPMQGPPEGGEYAASPFSAVDKTGEAKQKQRLLVAAVGAVVGVGLLVVSLIAAVLFLALAHRPDVVVEKQQPIAGSASPQVDGDEPVAAGEEEAPPKTNVVSLEVTGTEPERPLEGDTLRVYVRPVMGAARLQFRTAPDAAWEEVPLARRPELGAFGGLGARGMMDGPGTMSTNSAYRDETPIEVADVSAGELRLELRALDDESKTLAVAQQTYSIGANPWLPWRQTAVAQHGAVVDAVGFTPDGKQLTVLLRGGVQRGPRPQRDRFQLERSPSKAPVFADQVVVWSLADLDLVLNRSVVDAWSVAGDGEGNLLVMREEARADPQNAVASKLVIEGRSGIAIDPGGGVVSAALSGDGRLAGALLSSGTLHVWKTEDGSALQTFSTAIDEDASARQAVLFNRSGEVLVSAPSPVVVWSIVTRRRLRKIESQPVSAVAICDDGSLLATGAYDRIDLWQVEDGRKLRSLSWSEARRDGINEGSFGRRDAPRMMGDTQSIGAMAFTPDGAYLAASRGAEIGIWRVADGRRMRTLRGHDQPVTTLAFRHDGEMLASGAADKLVRLWRAAPQSVEVESRTAPAPLERRTVEIDALIAAGNLGRALDRMGIRVAPSAAEPAEPDLLDDDDLLSLDSDITLGLRGPASAETNLRRRHGDFETLIEQRAYKRIHESLAVVEVAKLKKVFQDKFTQIRSTLAAAIRSRANKEFQAADAKKGRERIEAEFLVYRRFPEEYLPPEFTSNQARIQQARRKAAEEKLTAAAKLMQSGNDQRISQAKEKLQQVIDMEIFLPDQAQRARRMLEPGILGKYGLE